MPKAIFVLGFILLSCSAAAVAVAKHDHFFVSAQYHHQYIWSHFKGMGDEVNNPAKSYEINIGWKASGDQLWHQLYNQPSYGIGFFLCDLNNPEVYGVARSGFLFMEFPLFNSKIAQNKLKVSLGLAHFNRHYDPQKNPLNINIGNSLNAHFNLNYAWFFPLTPRLLLSPGMSFTHFSNGAYKKPNRGFNLFDINLSLRYKINDSSLDDKPPVEYKGYSFAKSQKFFMTYSIGFMQRDLDDPVYMARTLTLNHTLQTGLRGRWGLGLDISYDDHSKEVAQKNSENYHFKEYFRISAFASHDILFDRLSILLNLGGYVYHGVCPESNYFSRIGLKYSIGRNLHAQMALKAHKGRADHVQWGLGYSL